MSETLTAPSTATPPELTDEQRAALKDAVSGYTPGQIPESDERPPPSVWPAGDVHHTHEQIYEESPAGVQAANAPDPRDAEIMRLNAIIAGTSKDPNAPAVDPKDAEIARLKALVNEAPEEAAPPVEVKADVVDPRDAELAQLRADLEARDSGHAPDGGHAPDAILPGSDAEVTPA